MKPKQEDPKEMVGGCCVCSDENGWAENPLVYCDGQGCNVAVHQACYGIVTVPTGSWFCRKCESQERAARVRCELCPSKDGALKRTDSGGWAHVVCALYIPEVRFGNVTTMEPIMLQLIPQERFNKSCYLCDEAQRGGKATIGACMQCNRAGCKNHFHVTCAQAMGLLCEEAGNYLDNVKYCGYCQYHYNKLRRGSHVKTIPPYRPILHDQVSSDEDKTSSADGKELKLKKRSSSSSSKSSPVHDSGGSSSTGAKQLQQQLTRDMKVTLGEIALPGSSLKTLGEEGSSLESTMNSTSSDFSVSLVSSSVSSASGVVMKGDTKPGDGSKTQQSHSNSSHMQNMLVAKHSSMPSSTSNSTFSIGAVPSDVKTTTVNSLSFPSPSPTLGLMSSVTLSSSSSTSAGATLSETVSNAGAGLITSATSQPSATIPSPTYTTTNSSTSSLSSMTTGGQSLMTSVMSSVSTIVSLPSSKIRISSTTAGERTHPTTTSHHHHYQASQSGLTVSLSSSDKDKHHHRKVRRNGPRMSVGSLPTSASDSAGGGMTNEATDSRSGKEGVLTICEERNLSTVEREKPLNSKNPNYSSEDAKLNVQYTPNVSAQGRKNESFNSSSAETSMAEPIKRSRSSSQDRGRRSKRGSSGGGGSSSSGGSAPKRGRVSVPSKEVVKESRDSGASSPESMSEGPPKRGRAMKNEVKEKDLCASNAVITNGVAANTLLLGNQINPASAVAQKMTDTLNSELEAHSIYKDEEKVNTALVGPALPGKRETSTPGILNSCQPPPLPQSLEQLLERQWEQGSQFLMEQAQHFDIASLLSCLHQLRQENVRLEETVNSLVARRDHLLAVNARLSVPLGASSGGQTNASVSQQPAASSISSVAASVSSSGPSSSVSITPAGSAAISSSSLIGGHLSQMSHSTSSGAVLSSRSHAQQQQQRHPSGGSAHSSHASLGSTSGSLSGRGTSPHDRKGQHQGPPLENGLGEPEYRYRSPGTDHQHRQQSPMLPPAAQPSPTSMRQSPASSGYHSGSSPHTGVPSLSPSGVNHPVSQPHTLVSHGHPSGLASSSHGPSHSVALSRAPPDHPRAELVRLASSQSHSSPGVGYPVYQMVSPPVPGSHHSPVGLPQHPSHSQVVRREVDSGRNCHSLEKR